MSSQNSLDFTKAKYTAVISDLHLCEAETVNPKKPLWKKFKTRDFFFDSEFKLFLNYLQKNSNGEQIELVLNGDIFDFDSMMALPEDPTYRISVLEKTHGLLPQEEKSVFKIKKILEDHKEWVESLRDFILAGNRAIFIIGNHDLELHFMAVQLEIKTALNLPKEFENNLRFNEWFYISNQDTLIEHSNQYDPYCVCQDPINPFVLKFNHVEVRLPFGNLASRYLTNAMGYFNPHADSNFIMSLGEYWNFFIKYIMRTQPLIIFTWFWGAVLTLSQSFLDRLLPAIKNPLTLEDRIEEIARKANATPRMVRELKDLTVHPASSHPLIIARELWLDRAFLVLIAFIIIFYLFATIKLVYNISFFWMFIPLFLYTPFFIFYAKSVRSESITYKEPKENILSLCSQITRTRRIVYGHTHIVRHEMVGDVEHLNSGTWSPAFTDVECTKTTVKKTFVWIKPSSEGRSAGLFEFKKGEVRELFGLDSHHFNAASGE